MANTGNFEKGTTLDIETTAYHEGVPGHHMQISIAQELPELPLFRQHEDYTAYVEGWALYSERLGKEAGFFQDTYSYYGHLQDDMLRAVRLVVDTGFHYTGRAHRAGRDRPLHGVAGPGIELQDRPTGDTEAAPIRPGSTQGKIQHSGVSRRGAGRGCAAAGRPQPADSRMGGAGCGAGLQQR